ncbi:DUF4062 domain-containing protein [Enterococcus sp. DIV0170]|uniref:DUF4062 domain-containing protein n=1 Tax=Enterococcus sp. DIV0170 TaxID=2774642 RepID=UPI003F1F8A52
MIFRPRIFVSSTFKGNEYVRNEIEKLLKETGAEPLLYETALTPSVLPLTYRQNILESDFVILFLKEHYGSKTNSGLSGTHEEYRLARENNIPMHVYILKDEAEDKNKDKKKESLESEKVETTDNLNLVVDSKENKTEKKKNKDLEKFLKELNNDGVSYYFYKSDDQLLKRIKETIFTIAKEVMLFSFSKMNISENDVAKLSSSKDYNKAIEIFKIINVAYNYYNHGEMSLSETNLFNEMFEEIDFGFSKQNKVFLDSKLDDRFTEWHDLGREICNMIGLYSDYSNWVGNIKLYKEPKKIFYLNYKNADGSSESDKLEEINEKIQEYFDMYKEFYQLVQSHKTFVDVNY